MYLKIIRRRNNVTQKEIAELLNVTQSQVSRFELGLSYLNSEQIIKICNYLKITSDELLGLKSFDDQAEEIIKITNTKLTKEEIVKTKKVIETIGLYIQSLIKEE